MGLGMDSGLILLLFAIGFVGSMLSGMVGIGGSIISYPMLLYIPPVLGFAAFSAQQASSVIAVQVFFATLAGLFVFRKGGYIDKALVLVMGSAIVIGSFAGGYGSRFLADSAINLTYAILALIAAAMMFLPRGGQEDRDRSKPSFNKPTAFVLAAIIGVVSGIVGAAGAFITVPVMLVVLRIPTRAAIASSLAITFVSSIGTVAGKLFGGHILPGPSVVLVVASLIAAPIGAAISKRVGTRSLQRILMALIAAASLKIGADLFL